MSTMNKHTPERFPTESQIDYRMRRRESKLDARLTDPLTGRPIMHTVNKSSGRNMQALRAARKLRNVRKARRAAR